MILPSSSSSFTCAAVVSKLNLLLDYVQKLNITEKEAVHSLGIHSLWRAWPGWNACWVWIFWNGGLLGFLNQRTASASMSPSLSIAPVFVASRESKSLQIPISLTGANHKTAETIALIDCRATGCFANATLVAHLGWKTTQLATSWMAYNVDRTLNNNGHIWLTVSNEQ